MQFLLLAILIASSATVQAWGEDPSVAATIGHHAPLPTNNPPPIVPGIGLTTNSAGHATDLTCTTYETANCGGGSALHSNMIMAVDIQSVNMNSMRCSRDLMAHERIDLSTSPGKRGIDNIKAGDNCGLFTENIHGSTTACRVYSRSANCMRLMRDDLVGGINSGH